MVGHTKPADYLRSLSMFDVIDYIISKGRKCEQEFHLASLGSDLMRWLAQILLS